MKKIIFIIPLLVFLFLFDSSSFAQQSSSPSAEEEAKMRQMASELGITFPIAELNNCAGPKECRDFCNQESNYETCTRFAKKYGFSREQEGQSQRKDEMLEKAKEELGCNSSESCSRVCEQNQEKCQQFARRHGYYQEDSRAKEYRKKQSDLVENAHSELGCNSLESCNSYCQKEENRERCGEFARRHGFDQGETRRDENGPRPTGPGGCRTEEACRKYYQEQQRTTTSPQTSGERPPCDSPESCRKYCQENPNKCPGYQESGTSSGNYPTPPQTTTVDPSTWCTNKAGCTFEQSTGICSCPVNNPTPTYETPSFSPSDATNAKQCDYSGCSWTGTTCVCPERVQGATTENPYDFHFQYIIEIQNLLH